jgi:hypothetical protein
MKMDRFRCHGWLRVTVDDGDLRTVKVRLTHALAHPSYTDISLPEVIAKRVNEMRDSSAAKVRDLPLSPPKHANI